MSISVYYRILQAECKKVEVDNRQLSAQVAQLKQRLVELEVRNGGESRTVTILYPPTPTLFV